MKALPVALVLVLAINTFTQSAAPATPPATTPATLPAPTLEAYQRLVGDRLAKHAALAYRLGVPLDVIENVGDARARFVADTKTARQKFQDSFTDLVGPTPDPLSAIDAKFTSLTDRKATAQLELEVKQTKEHAIQERIANLTRQIADRTAGDEILQSLQKLESVRRQEFSNLQSMVDSGLAQRRDLDAAESNLAAARIDVAKRRAEIASTAFGGALDVLNRLLIEVSLDVEEQQAMIKAVDSRLQKLQSAREDVRKFRELNTQLEALDILESREKDLSLP